MIRVPLSRGYEALVDDADAAVVEGFSWTADVRVQAGGAEKVYACRYANQDGRKVKLYLHREIVRPPEGLIVDHQNGDGLDCRRHNLRVATASQNTCNAPGASGYKGVNREGNRWRARVRMRDETGKLATVYNSTHACPTAAAVAYDRAVREIFGEFAWTNAGIPPEKTKDEEPIPF